MSKYAITADVHGHTDRLRAVLAHARQRGAEAFIDLGDVGTDTCYDLLRQVHAQAAFGNYEVSRWGNLAPVNQDWVRGLGPLLTGETFLAAHAVPFMPAKLATVENVLDYVLEHSVPWHALFPRLDIDDQARWRTYAELEERDKHVFLHGHTHVQAAWRIGPSGHMARQKAKTIFLDPRARYIIGVGSVGQPEDGLAPRYAIYDPQKHVVELCEIE